MVIIGVGVLFYYTTNVPGALIGDGTGNGCEPGGFTLMNPDSGEPYTSKNALREDVVQHLDLNQSEVNQYMENVELRDTENGTVLQKEEVCE